MTALTRLASLLGIFDTIPFANRNYIVDGNFDSWTASSGAAPSGTYGPATMYPLNPGIGGAATITQSGPYANSPIIGMTSPFNYALQFQQTTASTGSVAAQSLPTLVQRVEDARTLNGLSATFSCILWSVGGNVTIPAIRCAQNFGSGGSASVTLDKTINWVVTSTPTKFSVRLDFPSTAGKTFGTNNQVAIGLYFPGTLFQILTAQWQLEQSSPLSSSDINGKGGAPTAFEYRGQQAELARVQRHYEGGAFTVQEPAVGGAVRPVTFAVAKRATPAVAYSGTTYSGATGLTVNVANPNGFSMQFQTTAASGYVNSGWTADVRL